MRVTSTTVTFTCDNPVCNWTGTGPTVVQFNLEAVMSQNVPEPPELQNLITIVLANGKTIQVCCPACAAEVLGFPQPKPRFNEEVSANVIPFCRKPALDGIREISPDNGQEG